MDATFDSLYPPIPDTSHAGQRKRSRNFLASFKGLVKQPSRTRLEPPAIDVPALQPRSTSALGYHSRDRSRSPRPRIQAHSWGGSGSSRKVQRSREHIPSMIDYLTLAQLENVWHKQDSYKGCVSTPQTAPNPDLQRMEKRLGGWALENIRDPHLMDIHPALRVRSPPLDDSAWSRPPSAKDPPNQNGPSHRYGIAQKEIELTKPMDIRDGTLTNKTTIVPPVSTSVSMFQSLCGKIVALVAASVSYNET
ncbi:MAG: hypothetical protein Q9218_006123 [Villophora microphyllina]